MAPTSRAPSSSPDPKPGGVSSINKPLLCITFAYLFQECIVPHLPYTSKQPNLKDTIELAELVQLHLRKLYELHDHIRAQSTMVFHLETVQSRNSRGGKAMRYFGLQIDELQDNGREHQMADPILYEEKGGNVPVKQVLPGLDLSLQKKLQTPATMATPDRLTIILSNLPFDKSNIAQGLLSHHIRFGDLQDPSQISSLLLPYLYMLNNLQKDLDVYARDIRSHESQETHKNVASASTVVQFEATAKALERKYRGWALDIH
ncbi:MAG: hypothetical protein Q9218_001894 [Villophora microphyllina]